MRASIECCSGAAHLAEELIERAGWSVTLLREHRIAKPERIGAWSLMWFAWLSRLELDEVTRFLMDQHIEELQRLRGKMAEVEVGLDRLIVRRPAGVSRGSLDVCPVFRRSAKR